MTSLIAFIATLSVSVFAVDTLVVTTPDPVLEPWRWTRYELPEGARDVFPDREGNIWFATRKGVYRYDGHRWQHFGSADGLAGGRPSTIIQGHDGSIWVGAGGGVSRLTRGEGGRYAVKGFDTRDGLPDTGMWWRGLEEDGEGAVWAGFAGPQDPYDHAIYRFDGSSWARLEVPASLGFPDHNPNWNYIQDIEAAADGSVWFAPILSSRDPRGYGVLRYHPSPSPDESRPEQSEGAWSRYTPEDGLSGNHVDNILESSDGSIWFSTYAFGIDRYKDGQWQTYTVEDGLPKRTVRQSAAKLWETSDGTIWARTDGHTTGSASGGEPYLCRLDGDRWISYDPEDIQHVGAVGIGVPASDGSVWFSGGGNQAVRFDMTSRRWIVYKGAGSLSTFNPKVVVVDDAVWMALSNGGVVRYDPSTSSGQGVWTRLTAEDGLIDGTVTTILRAKDGSVWVAGRHGGKSGAARWDGSTWPIYTESVGVVGGNIYTGVAAENGDVWFGTRAGRRGSKGVLRFREENWKVYTTEDGLADNRIMDLAETTDGSIWAGTNRGLSRFKDGVWTSLPTEAPYVPGPSNVEMVRTDKIRTLCAGQDGSLWIGYGERPVGVTRYDLSTSSYTHYTSEDGLGEDQVFKLFAERNGMIWAGTSRFNGAHWSAYEPDILPVTNSRVAIGQGSDGVIWLHNGETIVRYSRDQDGPESDITVAAKDVSEAGNIYVEWKGYDRWDDTPGNELRYQWRMDRGEWGSASSRTDFTFTEMKAGNHTFEVRAIDRDLNYSSPAVHRFVVAVPWWRTPGALGLAALCVTGLAFVGIRARNGRGQGWSSLVGENETLQARIQELEERLGAMEKE